MANSTRSHASWVVALVIGWGVLIAGLIKHSVTLALISMLWLPVAIVIFYRRRNQ